MKVVSHLIRRIHESLRRRTKIKSISGKIVENAKEIDPAVFDTRCARVRISAPLFLSGGTP
jgi:hypothetical protein